MPFFSQAVAAALGGATLTAGVLVFLDFASAPTRLWLGAGPLVAGGRTWSGLGELGGIDGLSSAIGGASAEATFTLSGVDPTLVAETLAGAVEFKGRDVTVYMQVFDAALAPLDGPYAIYAGSMDVLSVKGAAATRTLSLTAETVFARKALPLWGYLSDRDQNRLHPGDRGLELVPSMVSKNVPWPPPFET